MTRDGVQWVEDTSKSEALDFVHSSTSICSAATRGDVVCHPPGTGYGHVDISDMAQVLREFQSS